MFFKKKKHRVDIYKDKAKITARELLAGKNIEVDKVACCPKCQHRFIVTLLIKNNLRTK